MIRTTARRVAAGVYLFAAVPAIAQPTVIESPEQARDGNFGIDVETEGGLVIVGSPEPADGDTQGNAYLFDAATGDLVFELFAGPGSIDTTVFGLSVSMGGGIAAVGAPGDEITEIDRVWVYDIATGSLIHELLPAPGSNLDEFGLVVSVTDTGAGADPIVAVSAGRLIVTPSILFQRTVELYNGRTGAHLASVLNDDAGSGAAMGQEIDAYHDGTKGRLVVAANSSTIFAQPGANAYLFDITDPTSPTQIASFIGGDTVDADEFATAVATDGTTVAVTSPLRTGSGGEIGAVYLFDADTGAETGTLARPADLPASLDGFAPTIDIADGNVIYGTSAGTTYVQSTDGTVIASLTSPDAGTQGVFGYAVSVESALGVINAAVSDPIAPASGGTDAGPGEVYAFADVSGTGGPTCVPDFAEPFGTLNFFDLSAFIAAFNAMDPAADLAAPSGVLNFFDVSAFISLYNAGCP